MWIDTQADSKRELQSCALIVVGIIYKGHSSRFPLVNHFVFPGSEFIFGISQDLPCVATHLLTKMDSTEEAYG